MLRTTEIGFALAILAGLPSCWGAQWRPSYQPVAATYGIVNDTFQIVLQYSTWQGYFNNAYTVPAGTSAQTLELEPVCRVIPCPFWSMRGYMWPCFWVWCYCAALPGEAMAV